MPKISELISTFNIPTNAELPIIVNGVTKRVKISDSGVGRMGTDLLDIYVSTSGDDASNGISSQTPLKTLTAALDKAARYISVHDNLTIHVVSGIYNEDIILPGVSSTTGLCTIDGNSSRINGNISAKSNAKWVIKNIVFNSATRDCITVGTTVLDHAGITETNIWIKLINPTFVSAAASYDHMFIRGNSNTVYITNPYIITGSARYHIYTDTRSSFWQDYNASPNLVVNNPAFTKFAYADGASTIDSYTPYSGSGSGQRYLSDYLSNMFVGGNGATHFPGTVSGIAQNSGLYVAVF